MDCKSLTDIASWFHAESEHLRKVAIWFVRAGVAIVLSSLVLVPMILLWAGKVSVSKDISMIIAGFVAVLALFCVQLIAKQIVGTREMIYAMQNRAKMISVFNVSYDLVENTDIKTQLLMKFLDKILESPDSPFMQGKVSGNVDMSDMIKVLKGIK